MMRCFANNLSFGRKALWVGVGIVALAGPVVFDFVSAPQIRAQSAPTTPEPSPSFEVASIKPNHSVDASSRTMMQPERFTATNTTVESLVALAYNVKDFQIAGGPSWVKSQGYDMEAKVEESVAEKSRKLPSDELRMRMRLMIQAMLADRFELKVSHQTKELPVYALVVAKGGPKFQEAKPSDTRPNGIKGPDGRPVRSGYGIRIGLGQITGQSVSMGMLVDQLSEQLDRNIVDETGLTGTYDFTLRWTPDQGARALSGGAEGVKPGIDDQSPTDSPQPSIFTAIQEQLGLKLQSTKASVGIIVIAHIEMPSEN